ncbi:MAG: DUF3054 domain-containing protein [Haloarculaceae archaeon]
MSVATSVRHRFDPAPLTAVGAAGDLVCIGLFVGLGATMGHDIGDPVRVAITFGTFAVGWTLASFVTGVHAADARRSARSAVGRTVPAWVAAAAVAQLLRATGPVPGNAALSFYLVSVGVGLALLVPWRLALAAVASRR